MNTDLAEWAFIIPRIEWLRDDLRKVLWISDRWVESARHFEYMRDLTKRGHIDGMFGYEGDDFRVLMRTPFLELSDQQKNDLYADDCMPGHERFGNGLTLLPHEPSWPWDQDCPDVYRFSIDLSETDTELKRGIDEFLKRERERRGRRPIQEQRGKTTPRTYLKFLGAKRALALYGNADRVFAKMSFLLSRNTTPEDVYRNQASLKEAALKADLHIGKWVREYGCGINEEG